MPLSRHRCREVLFQTLFAYEFRQELLSPERLLEELTENLSIAEGPGETPPDFLVTLTLGVVKRIQEIRHIIQEYAPEWPLDKINPIDRAIMYIGVFEILFQPDTPSVVAIDEAIELGKKFGNENTGRFVNGVLNTVLKHQEELQTTYPSSP